VSSFVLFRDERSLFVAWRPDLLAAPSVHSLSQPSLLTSTDVELSRYTTDANLDRLWWVWQHHIASNLLAMGDNVLSLDFEIQAGEVRFLPDACPFLLTLERLTLIHFFACFSPDNAE
jgi:hypothetical protein